MIKDRVVLVLGTDKVPIPDIYDTISLGSDCCSVPVHYDDTEQCWCSKCSKQCYEMTKTDEEFLMELPH